MSAKNEMGGKHNLIEKNVRVACVECGCSSISFCLNKKRLSIKLLTVSRFGSNFDGTVGSGRDVPLQASPRAPPLFGPTPFPGRRRPLGDGLSGAGQDVDVELRPGRPPVHAALGTGNLVDRMET